MMKRNFKFLMVLSLSILSLSCNIFACGEKVVSNTSSNFEKHKISLITNNSNKQNSELVNIYFYDLEKNNLDNFYSSILNNSIGKNLYKNNTNLFSFLELNKLKLQLEELKTLESTNEYKNSELKKYHLIINTWKNLYEIGIEDDLLLKNINKLKEDDYSISNCIEIVSNFINQSMYEDFKKDYEELFNNLKVTIYLKPSENDNLLSQYNYKTIS